MDVNDLTIVLAHFGQSVGSSAGGNVSAVPEPARWLCWPLGSPAYWPTPCGWHVTEPQPANRSRLRYRAAQGGLVFWPCRVRISLSSKPFLLLAFSALVVLRLFGDRARHSHETHATQTRFYPLCGFWS